MTGLKKIKSLIEKENVKQVILQFTDINGTLHSLWIPSERFQGVAEKGIHTDGSSVAMVDISESDLKLKPDLESFTVLPKNVFQTRVARVVCDLYEPESEKSFEFDPRFILKKVIKEMKETLGESVNYYASSEMEYFLFQKTDEGIKFFDDGRYLATPPADLGADLRLEIVEQFKNMGVLIEKHHHEVPPAKYELNVAYANALKTADTAYLVKFIVKLLASKKGLIASFMPKPFHGQYGAGLHTHVSLIEEDGKNLFYDSKGNYALSETALNFIAGILNHAKALAALTNPSVNSYKRLVPGWEAPVYISWAKYNRSVLVRVPPGTHLRTRLEYRPTDGSCNFYLAYAGILAAGLDGVKRKLKPPEPVEEDIYKMDEKERERRGIDVLPENLGEALKEFSKDRYLWKTLGEKFCEKFVELRRQDWREYNITVHEWEREKYLDV
ncbi:glutamine synthetase [Candidatus Bathyarchaeota archaeon]|nr:glutamine synthetase [Candidatus Bathyarchaeota archaeon]